MAWIQIRVTDQVKERAKKMARNKSLTLSAFILHLIANAEAKEERNGR